MEQYINEHGKPVWKGVSLEDIFSEKLFYEVGMGEQPYTSYSVRDYQWAFHSNLGSITVLDRMTGFGWRDTETGYRDPEGKFWLASGDQDVRLGGSSTVGEAIQWVKARANTCMGV